MHAYQLPVAVLKCSPTRPSEGIRWISRNDYVYFGIDDRGYEVALLLSWGQYTLISGHIIITLDVATKQSNHRSTYPKQSSHSSAR